MIAFARSPFPLSPGLLAKRPGNVEFLLCSLWSAALPPPYSITHSELTSLASHRPQHSQGSRGFAKGKNKSFLFILELSLPFLHERNHNFIHISQRYVKKNASYFYI